MGWNPFSRKNNKGDQNGSQGSEGYAGDYHWEITSEDEAEAIWKIVHDPDFDGWDETMGTVPHTPYQYEWPDDPDTEKTVRQPKPRK